MKVVRMGPNKALSLILAENLGIKYFIESGTYRGATTQWAAKHFKKVYTIEKSPEIYEKYKMEINAFSNIQGYLGDSKELLPSIVDEIGDDNAIFWLDAHWSGHGTAGEDSECPLIDELNSIVVSRSGDIVMIDDARLFLQVPPVPHKPSHWPNLFEISKVYASKLDDVYIQVIDDVIFIVPKTKSIVNLIQQFIRQSI